MKTHKLKITKDNYLQFRDGVLANIFSAETLLEADKLYNAGAIEFKISYKTKE